MMASHGKVLILDSDTARASDLCSRLHYLNYEPVIPSADNSSGAFLDEHGIAVVLGDLQRGDGMGRTLDELKARKAPGEWERTEEIAARLRSAIMAVPGHQRREVLLAAKQSMEKVQTLAQYARSDVAEKLSAIRRGKDATRAYAGAD